MGYNCGRRKGILPGSVVIFLLLHAVIFTERALVGDVESYRTFMQKFREVPVLNRQKSAFIAFLTLMNKLN